MIGGLDRQCDKIPSDKLVPAHGSISRVACEACGNPMSFDDFCHEVQTKTKDIYNVDPTAPAESSRIACPACGAPKVKPTTVLFGRALPDEFFERTGEDMPGVDLLLVAGTSLVVSPANSLVYRVQKDAQRVIVNKETVGEDLGIEYSDRRDSLDWFLQGTCDEVFLDLIQELGWLNDLEIDTLPEASARMVVLARDKKVTEEKSGSL